MSTPIIIGISAGGAVLLLIVLIVIIRISNTNRFNKKFKKQMEKIQEEDPNISFEAPKNMSMPANENNLKTSDKSGQKNNKKAIIEDYVDEDILSPNPTLEESDEAIRQKHEDRFAKAMKKFEEISKRNREEREKEGKISGAKTNEAQDSNGDDFEKFMDEHSYGRLFADKNLFEQIKDLSPEMKAILFSGIFRPYDENK